MFLTLCIHIPLISFHIRYDAALKQRSELKLKMRRNSVELKLTCKDYDIIFTSKPSIIKTYLSQICTQKIHVFTCTAHRRNLYVPGFLIVRQVHLACFTSGLETYPANAHSLCYLTQLPSWSQRFQQKISNFQQLVQLLDGKILVC